MANEINQEEENQEQTSSEESLNETEETTASDELAQRLSAFEARFERSEAEKENLRESLRLHQQLLAQQSQQNKRSELSPEMEELGRTINPLVQGTIKETVEPIVGTVSKLYDQNDAVQFQLALQREDPELLKDFDRISSVVEGVRQKAARESGSWVSRDDAYKYAKGAGLLKPKASVKAKPAGESKRTKEIANAQAAGSGSETRRSSGVNPEVKKIAEKAQRGERLTPAERAKWKEAIGDVVF